jgi:hypothetical protein
MRTSSSCWWTCGARACSASARWRWPSPRTPPEAGEGQAEPRLTVEPPPELLAQAQTREVPTSQLDPKDRLACWQRRLLDLSLRNALLNFKPGKKSLLLQVAAPALEDTLARGQVLKLLPSPELMQGKDPRSQPLHEARSLEDLRGAHAEEALQRREVFIDLEPLELDSRFVELFRGAHATRCRKAAPTPCSWPWAFWSGAGPTSPMCACARR